MSANDIPPSTRRAALLVPTLVFIALVVAVVGSLGAPLITEVAHRFDVSLSTAQWTLTLPLLVGAVFTPVLGRLGTGAHRRQTILTTLSVVVAGSVLTVIPPSFGWLLAGRTAQGAGFALIALVISVAREHVPGGRSRRTIALLSITSTIGIGVGYPLAGLLAAGAGISAAYGLGLLITVVALVAGWFIIPDAPARRRAVVDPTGAALLGGGLLALLLAVSETALWISDPVLAGALVAVAVVLISIWVRYETRSAAPLVNLAMLRHPAVAGANAVMLLGGIGMYLLLTLVTRYMQTPAAAGYGFGVSVFIASLVLVPFSLAGLVGGTLVASWRRRAPATLLVLGGVAVLVALVVFALARTQLWQPFAVMALLGLGIGVFSAVMPAAILAVTPSEETSSAMSFNQLVRSTGYAIGSALCGLTLAASTPAESMYPLASGYTMAAWLGVAVMLATVITAWKLR